MRSTQRRKPTQRYGAWRCLNSLRLSALA